MRPAKLVFGVVTVMVAVTALAASPAFAQDHLQAGVGQIPMSMTCSHQMPTMNQTSMMSEMSMMNQMPMSMTCQLPGLGQVTMTCTHQMSAMEPMTMKCQVPITSQSPAMKQIPISMTCQMPMMNQAQMMGQLPMNMTCQVAVMGQAPITMTCTHQMPARGQMTLRCQVPTTTERNVPVISSRLPTKQAYTVQPGDTLSTIAQRFSTTVKALAQTNSLQDPNLIFAGQRLWIPAPTLGSYTEKATKA